jgi:hypothetical protein
VDNHKSVARTHRRKDNRGEGDVLSPTEARGLDLKRYIRAAAALREIYNDVDLADAVEVTPGAVRGWWGGAMPKPETIDDLARATGLALDELTRFVYYDGPPPALPEPEPDAIPSERRRSDRRGATEG